MSQIDPHFFVDTHPYRGCAKCGIGPGAFHHNSAEVRRFLGLPADAVDPGLAVVAGASCVGGCGRNTNHFSGWCSECTPESIQDIGDTIVEAAEALKAGGTHMLLLDIMEMPKLADWPNPAGDPLYVDFWPPFPIPILPSDGEKVIGFGSIVSDRHECWLRAQVFIRRDCPDRLTIETDQGALHLAPVVKDSVCVALQFRRGPWAGLIKKE